MGKVVFFSKKQNKEWEYEIFYEAIDWVFHVNCSSGSGDKKVIEEIENFQSFIDYRKNKIIYAGIRSCGISLSRELGFAFVVRDEKIEKVNI